MVAALAAYEKRRVAKKSAAQPIASFEKIREIETYADGLHVSQV